jgi:hypothetical protein
MGLRASALASEISGIHQTDAQVDTAQCSLCSECANEQGTWMAVYPKHHLLDRLHSPKLQ